MAGDPPDPVERWILGACATWPKPEGTPNIQATLLYAGLTLAGAMQLRDFEGLTSTEAMAIWPHLRDTPMGFVDHLFSCLPRALGTASAESTRHRQLFDSFTQEAQRMAFCAGVWKSSGRFTIPLVQARQYGEALPGAIRQEQRRIAEGGLPRRLTPVVVAKLTNVRERTPPRAQSAPGLVTLKWCMKSLRTARESKLAPPPSAFAEVVRRMGVVPPGAMLARWQEVATSAPPELPVARAKWLEGLQPDDRSKFHVVLQEDSIWKTMASWRVSAAQYASAIQLWGRAAELCAVDPWPPSRGVLDAYAFFFKHGPSLSRYLSHIRSALRLLEAPVGVLADTAGIVRGAMRLSAGGVRFKPRADAEQTRALVKCARKDFGRSDIADSWVVARHFCLRYGAEVVPMQTAGNHSAVHVADEEGELPVVTLTLFCRKMHNSPVTVVRRCICKLQGRTLCGACVLKARVGDVHVFPHVSYTEGFAYLKAAAMHLRLERASEWGTHAFRRGWANEALKAGGATALFYSGGWRGVAAFSYVEAKARGALEAAEWLVEFSDSSDGDMP